MTSTAEKSPPTLAEVDACEMARYAAMTGKRRSDTVEYMQGAIHGRWGTISQGGRDYARRVLDALAASDPRP